MDNFRTPYNATCTSKSIIDKIDKIGLLPGVKNPKYSEILEALSVEGYFCYAEPADTFATTSRVAWCSELKYMAGTSLCEESFQYMHTRCIDAIEESISKALDILIGTSLN